MRTGCGCLEIQHEPLEFKITTPVPNLTNCPLILPNTNEEDWCRLKSKIIVDFLDTVKKLECGIQPDIEILLEEISLIYMNSNCGFGVTKKMYATDPEEDRFLRHSMFLSEFETQEEKDQVLRNLGIYDKISDMITKVEVNNIVNNTKFEIDNELKRKIGYVIRIGKMYYAFASSDSYLQWLRTENNNFSSNLILASWLGNDAYPTTYNIVLTFDDGNSISSSVMSVMEGQSITLPTYTYTGEDNMQFDGWYVNNDYTGTKYTGIYTPNDSIELFGRWKEASSLELIMYSFSTKQTDNYNTGTQTQLIKGQGVTVNTTLRQHYIPTDIEIEVKTHSLEEDIKIGEYDSSNRVYKIEDTYLKNMDLIYN